MGSPLRSPIVRFDQGEAPPEEALEASSIPYGRPKPASVCGRRATAQHLAVHQDAVAVEDHQFRIRRHACLFPLRLAEPII